MFQILTDPYRKEAEGNSIGDKLRYAALHGCETKWKQCGDPKVKHIPKGAVDRFGIPMDGS
eukprot:CAMPEP_0184328996 /NCGR_PEP_ID=MMETSP1049-20130417/143916_1 /TAXON_ID=77928 /ORGANISM="Proteomonas sulcata, Strain CCMP704" /LENGTH=60 /DNA_ID=CAMNT_0026651337 /DNA_START=715 /DNA_END=897 /DNA_ORIENTATION=+